jgi:hypothetical protein
MAKSYFYQQFNDVNQEKFKRRQRFMKRFESKMRLKKSVNLPRHHHAPN